jgi:hypothetical protein
MQARGSNVDCEPSAPPSQTLANQTLPRDDRPVADLVELAQVLALGRIDANGNLVPLQLPEFTRVWESVREKYPDLLTTTSCEAATWHRRQADESESVGDLIAARFHLDRALEALPRDRELLQARTGTEVDLAHRTRKPRPVFQGARIPPPDPAATAHQIDLSAHYNLGLRDSLAMTDDQNNFRNLPEGIRALGGIHFDLRGLVHLHGQAQKENGLTYPERAPGIPVRQKCKRLHFLQATSWEANPGVQIGRYVLHYADGGQSELPIVYGRDSFNYWFWGLPKVSDLPGHAHPVWTGHNPVAASNGAMIGLYKSTRENPRPEVEIVSIDFISDMTRASPFLVALTVE